MKQTMILLIAAMISFSQPATANDRMEIVRLIDAYGHAMSASDVDAVMALYTSDSVFMPSGLPTAMGWQAVKKAYEHEFQIIDLDVKAIVDEIVVSSDIAYARTRSAGHLTVLATKEKKSTESYRAFFIFRKEEGKWKIARFMFNFAK